MCSLSLSPFPLPLSPLPLHFLSLSLFHSHAHTLFFSQFPVVYVHLYHTAMLFHTIHLCLLIVHDKCVYSTLQSTIILKVSSSVVFHGHKMGRVYKCMYLYLHVACMATILYMLHACTCTCACASVDDVNHTTVDWMEWWWIHSLDSLLDKILLFHCSKSLYYYQRWSTRDGNTTAFVSEHIHTLYL